MSKSKKRKSPQAYMEKLQKQIAKDLKEKNFDSLNEANKYIQNKYIGKEINFDKTKSSSKEKAMDLIYEAWESDDIDEMITFAEKAIKLDENWLKQKLLWNRLNYLPKELKPGKNLLATNLKIIKDISGDFTRHVLL